MTARAHTGARPYDKWKRLIDVAGSVTGLVVTAPVQAMVAVLVWRKLGRPVLFRQQRPGLHGKPFTLVKFRSMLDVDESRGLITDAHRLTSFGARLRSTSVDELPTLWNVLRGDMSLVGPRPLLIRYSPYLTHRERRRLNVLPGITGLAQVSGRNLLSWDERLALDGLYVQRRSFALDLSILARTMAAVLRHKGVVQDPESVMQNLDAERAGRQCA